MDRARLDLMLGGDAGLRLRDGRTARVRPVHPADAAAVQDFVCGLSERSRRLRFFGPLRELSPAMLKRLTGADGRPDRVLVALSQADRADQVVALAQYAADDDRATCDLALVIADDWQGVGLGSLLLGMLIDAARDTGFTRADADVLRGNEAMLGLARAFGFAVTHSPHDATLLRITRNLRARPQPSSFPSSLRRGGCEATGGVF